MISLWFRSDSGGAGSVEDRGIGSGTERMVKRRSGGDISSMGNIAARVAIKVVRIGGKRSRRVDSRVLRESISNIL